MHRFCLVAVATVVALFAFAPTAAACNQECILVEPGCIQCQTLPFYTGLQCRTSLDGCSCFYGPFCAASESAPPAAPQPDFLSPEPEMTPRVPVTPAAIAEPEQLEIVAGA